MAASRWTAKQVFLYREPVDMRKGAAGLAALVSLDATLLTTVFMFSLTGRSIKSN
jgi:hypothetical protein